MDNAQLIGVQAQRVLQRRMEIAANNLANVSTTGFRAELLVTEEFSRQPAASADEPHNIRFVRDITVARDMRQGPIRVTGEPFDVAIDGEGFFMVMGPEGTAYTRSGAFTMSADGTLVTSDGYPVLDSGGAPIQFDPRGDRPQIGHDGAISVAGNEVGRIGAATFARPGALSRAGDSLWLANGETPGAFEGRIVQGALEDSNVQPVLELTRLIEISRAYENAARIVSNSDQTRQRALERLGR
ncbi:MAG: flagellar basal-body rod protein FlgF [Hyphomonadaceae bacterium]